MQVGQQRVIAVRVEGLPGLPLDEDEYLPGRDVADQRFVELAERDDASTVSLNCCRRAPRVFEVLVAIRDVEQVQRVYGHSGTLQREAAVPRCRAHVVAITQIVILLRVGFAAYRSAVPVSVGSIPVRVPRASPVPFRQALFVAVTAGLGYGFDSYAVNIYGLVLPEIKRTLHITDAQAAYIGSIFLLGYTIGPIGFGLAADRWGRKTTLNASILLHGITTALAGLTTNIAAFTGLRFLTGVGGAGELAVGAPYTAEVWPAKTRAIGVGGVSFSRFSLGYVLAAGVSLVLVPHFGWQSAFIVAIVPAIILFLVRRGITESRRYVDVQARTTGKPRLWHLPGVRRRLVAGWLIYTANAVGYWGMTLF